MVLALVAVGCVEDPPPEPPPPFTEAQRAWIRDVCVPNAMRGEYAAWAVSHCKTAARQVVK